MAAGQRGDVVALAAATVATVGGFITAVMNFLTDMFLTPPLKATLQHLEETELKTMKGGESAVWICLPPVASQFKLYSPFPPFLPSEIKTLKAKSLWEKTGAVIMAVRRPG